MQTTIKRPGLLKVVCVLGFISVVFSFPSVFSPAVKKMGDWYPAVFGLIVAACFISYIGVWHMKRWSVRLFIVTFFLNESLLALVNDFNPIGFTFSVLCILPMLIYYNRMDVNL